MSVQEYVERVQRTELYDPVLTFQLANGFSVKRVVRGTSPTDDASHGYAILLEWPNLHYTPDPNRRTQSSFPVRVCTVQYRMRKIDSWEDFAQQVEYFVDVAAGYRADFVLFPEMFTLQLLSFLPQKPTPPARPSGSSPTSPTDSSTSAGGWRSPTTSTSSPGATTPSTRRACSTWPTSSAATAPSRSRRRSTSPRTSSSGGGPRRAARSACFDTDRGRIAISICYDTEFPEMTRIATEKGAQILFVPFCTDNRQGHLRVMRCAQARAIENQLYVVTSGCVGNIPSVENMDIHYAQSGIFTPSDFPFPPDGIAGLCEANIETVVMADLDLEVLRRNRAGGTVRCWRDRRSTSTTTGPTRPTAPSPRTTPRWASAGPRRQRGAVVIGRARAFRESRRP
jgi:predicted amidohydrolase